MAGMPAMLAGCSYFSGSDAADVTAEVDPPGELYAEADGLLERGKYERAAKRFEEVDRQHPYSPHARRALAMSAFAYYKEAKYPEAISAGRRYTALHPGTSDAALAHHIIAMSYFEQMSDESRDQSFTEKALKEFELLVRRYPDNKYAQEAQNRIRICRDVLAASEMNVGRFYLERGNYLASINRFKTVVQKYQNTAHVEEALMRLTEAYMALGIKNEAQTAAAVLGHNFPESQWYADAYALLESDGLAPREHGGSWISKAWSSAVSSLNPFE